MSQFLTHLGQRAAGLPIAAEVQSSTPPPGQAEPAAPTDEHRAADLPGSVPFEDPFDMERGAAELAGEAADQTEMTTTAPGPSHDGLGADSSQEDIEFVAAPTDEVVSTRCDGGGGAGGIPRT